MSEKLYEKSAQPGIMLYFTNLPMLEALPPEEAGQMLLAAMYYVRDGKLPCFTGHMELLWLLLKPQFDRDMDRYRLICEKRREAANRRWEKERTGGEMSADANGCT